MKFHILFFMVLAIVLNGGSVQGQFTDVSASSGLNTAGKKDGGVSWGDFNGDGCPDVIFNTDNGSGRSRLFVSDCNLSNPTFTDVTATHAAGLLNRTCERSIVWADFNHDGYLDFARNSNPFIEIYLNKGPSASPPYSFGDAGQGPNRLIQGISGGMNTEGMGWIDYNEDGWLDLVVDNHNFGIDLFINPANGTANFEHTTPNGAGMGLPEGARTGDYMALSDYDDNGTVDILCRKENEFDLWTNNGAGSVPQFSPVTTFDQQANNGNKGGVLFADFDNDGDFDIFWSDAGNNQNEIFLQTAAGTFVATGEPAASSGVAVGGGNINVDGCAAADVDHDGKIDLFLSNKSGTSFLFKNNTPNGGALTFSQNNQGIDVDGNGEGCAFVDYDQDGDMDLYVNVNNGPNQLWRNGQNDANYLKVRARFDLGGGLTRDDIGATVTLLDCNSNVVGGIRDVNGTRGHGSQDYPEIHFGLPNGANSTYIVRVGFTRKNGLRTILEKAIVPSTLPGQTLIISNVDMDDLSACAPLSTAGGIRDFRGTWVDRVPVLTWKADENNSTESYRIERAVENGGLETVGEVPSLGLDEVATYQFEDFGATTGGALTYQLTQIDPEGKVTGAGRIEVRLEIQDYLAVYPVPVPPNEPIQVELAWGTKGDGTIEVYDLAGKQLLLKAIAIEAGLNHLRLDREGWVSGVYFLCVQQKGRKVWKKVLLD